jgi:hypothetical protein
MSYTYGQGEERGEDKLKGALHKHKIFILDTAFSKLQKALMFT